MAPLGNLILDTTFHREGTENGQEKVVSALKASFQVDPNTKIDASIASQEGKGAFFFDTKAGRMTRSTVSQKMELVAAMGANKSTQITEMSTDMKLVSGDATPAK